MNQPGGHVTNLTPCTDAHCILAEHPRRGMCTQGGCSHLKERGPQLTALLRAMGAEIVRLRAAVARRVTVEIDLEQDLLRVIPHDTQVQSLDLTAGDGDVESARRFFVEVSGFLEALGIEVTMRDRDAERDDGEP